MRETSGKCGRAGVQVKMHKSPAKFGRVGIFVLDAFNISYMNSKKAKTFF